jgi:hypothetical protein
MHKSGVARNILVQLYDPRMRSLRSEMRSRLASSTSSLGTFSLSGQRRAWACTNALWHACWPYSCTPRSAQRLNSADTACCCRAPNSLRASSLRPYTLLGSVSSCRALRQEQPRRSMHIAARRADPDGVLFSTLVLAAVLQERRAVSQAHWLRWYPRGYTLTGRADAPHWPVPAAGRLARL